MKVNCPHCGQKYDVEERHCGLECECQNCEKTFIVPVLPAESPAAVGAAVEATKLCPFCAEPIQADARKCKHCGEFLNPHHKTSTRIIVAIIIFAICAVIAAAVFYGRSREQNLFSQKIECLNRMKQTALSIFMYASDYDEMPGALQDMGNADYEVLYHCPHSREYVLPYHGDIVNIADPENIPILICPTHLSVYWLYGNSNTSPIESIRHHTAQEAISILGRTHQLNPETQQQIKDNWN